MSALERPDDLIKSREAAQILHRDIRTVHRWAEDGRLPVAVRVPGYRGNYLFSRAEIEEIRMTELEHVDRAPAVNVDAETLTFLGYDPGSVATRALVLLALRYELDPLLGEIQLIDSGQGTKLYVTRDGMLAVAHRSGQLDGIVVEQQRRNSTNDGWTAYVSVWRKDMGHPFTYGAQCKDGEIQAKRGNGPEQALARAERRALRRAFQIRTDFNPERPHEFDDVDEFDAGTALPPQAVPASAPVQAPDREGGVRSGDWDPDGTDQAEAHTTVANLPVKQRLSFLRRHGIDDFAAEWPPEAVAEVLAGPVGVTPAAGDTTAGPASEP